MYGLVTFQQVVPIHLDKHNQFKYHYTEIQIVIDSLGICTIPRPTYRSVDTRKKNWGTESSRGCQISHLIRGRQKSGDLYLLSFCGAPKKIAGAPDGNVTPLNIA